MLKQERLKVVLPMRSLILPETLILLELFVVPFVLAGSFSAGTPSSSESGLSESLQQYFNKFWLKIERNELQTVASPVTQIRDNSWKSFDGGTFDGGRECNLRSVLHLPQVEEGNIVQHFSHLFYIRVCSRYNKHC